MKKRIDSTDGIIGFRGDDGLSPNAYMLGRSAPRGVGQVRASKLILKWDLDEAVYSAKFEDGVLFFTPRVLGCSQRP